MFKVGDKVIVQLGRQKGSLEYGEVYTVRETYEELGKHFLRLEEIPGCVSYYASRFEPYPPTGVSAVSVGAHPDPTQPYPNPEREAAEQQLRELVEYKRKMRDFLYGTSSTDN